MSKNIKKFKRFNSSKQYLSNPKKNSQIEEINSFINKNQSYTKLFSNSVIKNYTPLSQKDKLNMFQNINENSKNRFLEYNKLFDNIKNEIIDINKSIISYDNYSPKNSSLIIEPFSLNSSSKKINIINNKNNNNNNNNNNINNNNNNNINNINNLKGNFQSIIERPEEQFSSPYILFTKEKNKIKKKKRKNSNKKRAKSPHIRYDSNNLDLDINLSSLNENKEEIITEPTSRKNYNENQNYSNSNNNNIISLNSSHGSSSMKNLNLKRNVFIQKYNNINNLNGNKFFNNLYYQKDVEFYYEPTLEKNNFNECYYYCDNDCICF